MLAIIDDEHHAALLEMREQRIEGRAVARFAEIQARDHRIDDEPGIAERREFDETHVAWEFVG